MTIAAKQLSLALHNSISKHPNSVNEIINSFSLHILKRRMMKHLPRILRQIDNLQAENKIIIKSRYPLNELQLSVIKNIVNAKIPGSNSYVLENKISELIGGITIETKTKILDLSLDNSIEKLKEQLWTKK